MKKILQYTFAFLLTIQLYAQEKIITGIVSDENGLPLPTATVLVKGSTNGTSTDFDGKYKIRTNVGDVLIFNYVGYAMQNITVTNVNTINVSLQPDNTLDEVVVTALGISFGRRHSKPTAAQLKRSRKKAYHNQVAYQSSSKNASINKPLQGEIAGLEMATSMPSTKIVLRGSRMHSNT
ncbi:MAG: carboxypeptidase-like regulatory domain-containing protein, partial [Oceanihabitans sp.]